MGPHQEEEVFPEVRPRWSGSDDTRQAMVARLTVEHSRTGKLHTSDASDETRQVTSLQFRW